MSKKANPLAIGIFVTGAAIIALFAIIMFGAGKFFKETNNYICFFNETINGLDVGAPVKYRGVKIGKVEKIIIRENPKEKKSALISVVFSVSSTDYEKMLIHDKFVTIDDILEHAIQEGLRAKLSYLSFVTGMLYIELDFFEERHRGFTKNYEGPDYIEVPTAQSGNISEFSKKMLDIADSVAAMNLGEIGTNLNNALLKVNQKLDELDVKTLNDKSVQLLSNADALLTDADLKKSLKNMSIAVENLNLLLLDARNNLNSLSEGGNKLLEQTQSLVTNANSFISPQSQFRYELSALVTNARNTASSLRELLEYIERNPNSIITGKAKQGK